MYGWILLLHILSATVWTGGHLTLAIAILPRALRKKDPAEILRFESAYERIGLPSLLIQALTGLWLAHRISPDIAQWFTFGNPVASLVATKLILLAITLAFAIHARLRVIPRLAEHSLTALAWHVIPVTIISTLFVFVGVSFRVGWFY